MKTFVLGLTGSVGAGKSTAARALEETGFARLDVDDVIAAALRARAGAVLAVVPQARAPDGQLDSRRLFGATLVDTALRAQVQALVLDDVRAAVRAWRGALTQPGVLEAALLFEVGLDALCEATVCVTCATAVRRARVEARATASAALFDAVEAAQWPEEDKARRAGEALSGESSAPALAQWCARWAATASVALESSRADR